MFGEGLNTGIFFSAGALLLTSSLLYTALLIRQGKFHVTDKLSVSSLILKNLYRNRSRSIRIIILFSLGTFVIISTGLNRKDLHSGSQKLSSGTGGFLFFMETTLPILNDLNAQEISIDPDIDPTLNFIQLRKNEGDDASCLNLNRVTAPQILGLPSEELAGRFSFIKSTADLNQEAPWISLKTELPGNVIPAIADQTVIQWGLGKKVGDTLIYQNELGQEIYLKLIGGLANSIFQGNVLIDEDLFLKHFPSSSGSHVFLVDGKFEDQVETASSLQRAFRNDGIEIELAADRLAMFNQIENTYLSIFLLLGGLAMILGTVGLGVSLARNILDRQQEIGILRAIGYQKNSILNMITREHLILLLIGTLTGAISAFVATLPSLLSDFISASWQTAAVIILLIILNGFVWITAITRNSLKRNLMETLRTE
jgi:ABC-type antimicrobial peptide transport system permease subunit